MKRTEEAKVKEITTKTLQELLREYFRLQHNVITMKKTMDISFPTKPKSFDWKAEYWRNFEAKNHAETRYKQVITALSVAEKALIEVIPVPNTWIKVDIDGEAYGVATYTSAWGGNELAVARWEQTPQISVKNRMEFP